MWSSGNSISASIKYSTRTDTLTCRRQAQNSPFFWFRVNSHCNITSFSPCVLFPCLYSSRCSFEAIRPLFLILIMQIFIILDQIEDGRFEDGRSVCLSFFNCALREKTRKHILHWTYWSCKWCSCILSRGQRSGVLQLFYCWCEIHIIHWEKNTFGLSKWNS